MKNACSTSDTVMHGYSMYYIMNSPGVFMESSICKQTRVGSLRHSTFTQAAAVIPAENPAYQRDDIVNVLLDQSKDIACG